MRLIFDIETDGFLEAVTRVHCLVIKDVDTGQVYTFSPHFGVIDVGVELLSMADLIAGHNVIKFDIPVLQKLYPWFKPKGIVRDTLVLSRLIWPDLKKHDLAKVKEGKYPGKLVNKYSLEAWGHRLGNYKGDYKGGWEVFSQEMLSYCVQDVELTADLFKRAEAKNYSAEAIELEHRVAEIVALQERHGFAFNEAKAADLYVKLSGKRDELEAQLRAFFKPWFVNNGPHTAGTNTKAGYVKGVEFTKVKAVEFNPASLDHIANRLMTLYGWKPSEYTDGGKPKVDEAVLKDLDYPCVPMLREYLLVQKRIGQVAEGKEAWLKSVKGGRIHGAVNTNGAVTGRMTHFKPNVAQVPAVKSPYGAECRELFEAGPGKVLVGADASGLELRCLAHFMARWDGGAYAEAVVDGDVHSINQAAAGLPTRDNAKTFIYAYLYGAGDEKIGKITGKGAGEGKRLKAAFLKRTPALAKLKDAIAEAVRQRKMLIGLDGRQLNVRSAHAALNTLLQSAGALVMKKALVLLYDALIASGLSRGRDFSFVANIHDEWQIEVNPEIADNVGRLAVESIRGAGEHFKFRCPLDGEYKIGDNWRDTH